MPMHTPLRSSSYYGVRRPLHQFGLFASERLLKPPYIIAQKVQLLQRFATFKSAYNQCTSQECTFVTNSVNAINYFYHQLLMPLGQ